MMTIIWYLAQFDCVEKNAPPELEELSSIEFNKYSLYPHLGGRLSTFHDEPELFGRPFRGARMFATVRTRGD